MGEVSALVRDLLWEKCEDGKAAGRCYQAFTTNTEQGYDLRCSQDLERTVVHHEGLALIASKNAAWHRWRRFGDDDA